ncbi:Type II/IV secretion system protein [Bifidobacterium pseudolongum subsp. pseudolongum]|nr:Type II/IV secretion system protein [Bifidobacterium pseudolongum subsp. pseudolongum]
MGHTAAGHAGAGHTEVGRAASKRAAAGCTAVMTPERGWHMVPAGARQSTQTAAQSVAPPLAQQPAHQSVKHPTPALQLGPLERFACDGTVTDVVVTCDGAVWVDCGRGMQLAHTAIPLHDPHVLRDFAVRLCAQLGCRLDESCPIADASAPDGTRVHAVVAPIVPHGASISIRFPDRVAPDLDVLARLGMCLRHGCRCCGCWCGAARMCSSLEAPAWAKRRCSRRCWPVAHPQERIVTVEEVRELNAVPHAHTVSLVARAANVEGRGAVGLPDLVKATLRMRPDRVVVGECRGEEVADLLRALNSGHRGSFTTVHADSVARVPGRLIALGLLAGLEPRATAILAEGAFDVLLHLERGSQCRRIAQIGMVQCVDGRLCGRVVAQWSGTGNAVAGEAWGDFVAQWKAHGSGGGS